MREDAHITEIAALKGTLQSREAEIDHLQGKVTLISDKRGKWQRVWDSITDTREVMMTELAELRAEQRQLRAQIEEDLVDVASVLNTCADLQLELTFRHRATMDKMEMVMGTVTDLASGSASRDSVLTEKVARIQEVLQDQRKKTDELLALSRSRQR